MDEPEVLLLKPLQVVPKLLVVAELTEDTPENREAPEVTEYKE